MNPKDSFSSRHYEDAYDAYAREADFLAEELKRKMVDDEKLKAAREALIREQRAEAARKRQEATDAYNMLCDVLGVNTLNASIDGEGSHFRVPVESLNLIASRVQALQLNVLAEGTL